MGMVVVTKKNTSNALILHIVSFFLLFIANTLILTFGSNVHASFEKAFLICAYNEENNYVP